MYLQAQVQYIQNQVMRKNYEALLRSKDFQYRLTWDTQAACCDAYHLKYQPENIRCCVLGQRYGLYQ